MHVLDIHYYVDLLFRRQVDRTKLFFICIHRHFLYYLESCFSDYPFYTDFLAVYHSAYLASASPQCLCQYVVFQSKLKRKTIKKSTQKIKKKIWCSLYKCTFDVTLVAYSHTKLYISQNKSKR